MSFLGIPLVTVAEGEISELHIGLKGTMSALYLKDLAQKTHRGLEGRVRDGKSAGGISYGYRARRELRPDGTITTGERLIDPEQAAIVTRIFTEYASGLSARAIAAALNDEGIASPDSGKGDGTWGPSTISGNWKRGTGILNNELYIGRLIWNRQHFVKNPVTQKRQARPNPPEDWILEEVPELRIISDDLWQATKDRQGAIRADMNPAGVQSTRPRPERARRPEYLFSGLVKCGCCGASYTLINKTRYGCAAPRTKGDAICTNRATILREEVENRVLDGLREKLLHPELIAAFVEEYRKAFNAAAGDRSGAQDNARRELKQIEKKIAGILTAIEDGMYHPSMKAKIADLENRKSQLTTFLEDSPGPPCPAAASAPVGPLPREDRKPLESPPGPGTEAGSDTDPAKPDHRDPDAAGPDRPRRASDRTRWRTGRDPGAVGNRYDKAPAGGEGSELDRVGFNGCGGRIYKLFRNVKRYHLTLPYSSCLRPRSGRH